MPTSHPFPDPKQPDRQLAESTQRYLHVLHGLIDVGANLARLVNEQAEADAADGAVLASAALDASVAFERIARTVRRTITLARHVAGPLPERAADGRARQDAQQRTAARKQVIRRVEDAIHRRARSGDEAESLETELLERLDGPDLDDWSADRGRPVGDVINDICADLGLSNNPGMPPSKRRTPADIAVLCARAAGENVPTPASAVREPPPSAWTSRSPLASLADATDAMLSDTDPADP